MEAPSAKQASPGSRPRLPRRAVAVTAALAAVLAGSAFVLAAPPPGECAPGTVAFKLEVDDENLGDGVYSDGTLEVTVDFTLMDEGEQKRFDWTANMGVDRVAVKAQGVANYDYSPEATSGTGLTAPASKGISHIMFCYDVETPPTGTPTVTPTPPTVTPTPPPPPPACEPETEDCCSTVPSDCPPPPCNPETEDCCATVPSDCPPTPCNPDTEDCCATVPSDCPPTPCNPGTEDCCATVPSDCPVTPTPPVTVTPTPPTATPPTPTPPTPPVPPTCEPETEDCCATVPSDCPPVPCNPESEDCCGTVPEDCPVTPTPAPEVPVPPTEVPFFPGATQLLLAAGAVLGAGMLMLRRKA